MVTSRFLFFVSVTIAVASASVLIPMLPSQSAVSFSEREEIKKFKYEWKLPKSRKGLKLNDETVDDKMHGKRRVMPWVSIAVLLIFLVSFRSFAAPFFDPLVSAPGRGFVNCHALCIDDGRFFFAKYFIYLSCSPIFLLSFHDRENHVNQVDLQYTFS